MIAPRTWIRHIVSTRRDYRAMQISSAIDASKGDKLPHLAGLFYKQPFKKRSQNGFKGANMRMVKKFVAGLSVHP